MKKILIIIGIFIFIIKIFSCSEKEIEASFKDQRKMTIYDYIVENQDKFSSFLTIIKKVGVDKLLTAYNPKAIGYTLFLPDNTAIDEFIRESGQFSSLDDMLRDSLYLSAYARFHIVELGINSNDFPFGALPEKTLSGDLLAISFVIQTDTSYYKINNQSPVIKTNIELSNGYIHLIGKSLSPITLTSYTWIAQNPGFSIFTAAIDATGLKSTFDLNVKVKNNTAQQFTLLVEHDSIYHKRGIYSLDDLATLVSPRQSDYTNSVNPLYNFVAYHLLAGTMFLDDFVGQATNYTTYSEIPVYINGTGLDITINMGKEVFDTIIHSTDTTIIDYIGFFYDASNVLTQSGSVHFIDQVLFQQKPSRAVQTFEFYDEPLFNKFREKPGTYIIENHESLSRVKWSGTDLYFIKSGDTNSGAWSGDYVFINGDFSVSYTIPKLVQGRYTVLLGTDLFNDQNAVVQVFIDGVSLGGIIDLSTGGSASWAFRGVKLGTINFLKFDSHIIEVKSMIPGQFKWDYIRFEPI